MQSIETGTSFAAAANAAALSRVVRTSLALTSRQVSDHSWQAFRCFDCIHYALIKATLASNPVGKAVAFPGRLVVLASDLQALLTVQYANPRNLMKGP